MQVWRALSIKWGEGSAARLILPSHYCPKHVGVPADTLMHNNTAWQEVHDDLDDMTAGNILTIDCRRQACRTIPIALRFSPQWWIETIHVPSSVAVNGVTEKQLVLTIITATNIADCIIIRSCLLSLQATDLSNQAPTSRSGSQRRAWENTDYIAPRKMWEPGAGREDQQSTASKQCKE